MSYHVFFKHVLRQKKIGLLNMASFKADIEKDPSRSWGMF